MLWKKAILNASNLSVALEAKSLHCLVSGKLRILETRQLALSLKHFGRTGSVCICSANRIKKYWVIFSQVSFDSLFTGNNREEAEA